MALRKNDAILIGFLILINVVNPFLGSALKDQHPIIILMVQMMFVFGVVGFMIFRSWKLEVDASSYDIFRVTMDPPGTKIDIPVRRGWKRETYQDPLMPWLNVTPIEFAEEMKIEPYGENIKRGHITHSGSITNRLVSSFASNVEYKGEEIKHNTVYLLELWQNDAYPVSQDESRQEPHWVLISASKADRSDAYMKSRTLAMALSLDKKYTMLFNKQPQNVQDYISKLQLENQRLLEDVVENAMYIPQLIAGVEHHRISSINKEGKLESANQEITGMVEDDLNVKKAGERRLESKITNINDVFQLGKEKSWLNNIDWKWIAIGLVAIIAMVVLWQSGTLKDIGDSIKDPTTMVLLLFIVIVLAVAAYYLSKIVKGEKNVF